MAAGYIPADRHKRITQLIRKNGVVEVTGLSRMLRVSEITIRRDLDILEEKGILERTHGGALCTHHLKTEHLYSQRDHIDLKEKIAIGKAVSKLIDDGDTLLINSGSTTLQLIPHLNGRNITVITSNIGVLPEARNSDIELILVGGVYRKNSNSIVGNLAVLSLNQIYGDKAIIGVDGFSIKYGLTTPIEQEAEIAREMIERTHGPVIVAADHRKIGAVSNFVTAPVSKVDTLVTDENLSSEYRKKLEEKGINIIIAKIIDSN